MEENIGLLDHFVFVNSKLISINENDYTFYSSDFTNQKEVMDELKKINILVGANNSGKSRVLRAMFAQKELKNLKKPIQFKDLCSKLKKEFQKIHSTNIETSLSKTNDLLDVVLNPESPAFDDFTDKNKQLNQSFLEVTKFLSTDRINDKIFSDESIDTLKKYLDFIQKMRFALHKLYIPTLRGMRPLGELGKNERQDLNYIRTCKDYFSSDTVQIDNITQTVFTGFTIFSELESKLLGTQQDRNFVKAYEDFLSKNFFDNQPTTLIPKKQAENDVVFITFNNDEKNERPLYNLGDGLQNIITITWELFSWAHRNTSKENVFLLACIEEPELYLHPSMQRKLIKILLTEEKFKKIQYVVTTHSNHFLDLTHEFSEKVSIYSIRQDSNHTKHVTSENNVSKIVYNLLGARPSSLLLANKTIWIEGISDRIYIRKAIELYLEQTPTKNCTEYIDYAFVEYSGSNLDHYFTDEQDHTDLKIESLSDLKNVFLLVDHDGVASGKKFDRYKMAHEKLEDNFKKTDGREIENYLTKDVLKKIYNSEEDTKKIDKIADGHEKNTDKKLAELLLDVKISTHLNKKEKNIYDKQKFAQNAIEFQKKFNDLSQEMQELTKIIMKFIQNNSDL